jgi:hypothetical protein
MKISLQAANYRATEKVTKEDSVREKDEVVWVATAVKLHKTTENTTHFSIYVKEYAAEIQLLRRELNNFHFQDTYKYEAIINICSVPCGVDVKTVTTKSEVSDFHNSV